MYKNLPVVVGGAVLLLPNENPPVLLESVLLAAAPNAKVDEDVLDVVVTVFELAPPPKVNGFPELAPAGGASFFGAAPNVKRSVLGAEVSGFLMSVFAIADPKSKDGGAFEAVVTGFELAPPPKVNVDEAVVLDGFASVFCWK